MKRTCINMRTLGGCVVAVALTVKLGGAAAAISDCIDATCRISAGDARGTGCAFEHSQGYVYVLTNAHVVGANDTVTCEFWRAGHRSEPIRGRVMVRVDDGQCDAAVIAVPDSARRVIILVRSETGLVGTSVNKRLVIKSRYAFRVVTTLAVL